MKKIITIIITVVISGNSWGVGLGNLEGIVEDIKQTVEKKKESRNTEKQSQPESSTQNASNSATSSGGSSCTNFVKDRRSGKQQCATYGYFTSFNFEGKRIETKNGFVLEVFETTDKEKDKFGNRSKPSLEGESVYKNNFYTHLFVYDISKGSNASLGANTKNYSAEYISYSKFGELDREWGNNKYGYMDVGMVAFFIKPDKTKYLWICSSTVEGCISSFSSYYDDFEETFDHDALNEDIKDFEIIKVTNISRDQSAALNDDKFKVKMKERRAYMSKAHPR